MAHEKPQESRVPPWEHEPKKVFQAINAIQGELAKTGITKSRKNKEQQYQFRGIDDVYNVVSPLLAQYKLVIIPSYTNRIETERKSAGGKPIFSVVVEGEFTFISAEDNSSIVARAIGEGMDMADKATNKAMSAAYKNVMLQTFAIPTEGDNDADATTHEVVAYTEEQIKDALMALAAVATDGMGAVQTKMETLDKGLADHLREFRRAEMKTIAVTAKKNAKPASVSNEELAAIQGKSE